MKKKMGLVSCICMGIGAIIGSGIFGAIPTSIGLAGDGTVFWVMVAACVVVLFRSLPALLTTSMLPANAANYMHATRLINPWVGYINCVNNIFNVLTIVLMAVVFAPYFTILFPMDETLCKVLFLAVMGIVAWFGTQFGAVVQNIVVICLLGSMGIYIVLGLPMIDAQNLTLGEILAPSMTVNGFVAAVGVMQSSTYGAHQIANFAEDIENPGRNVPLAVFFAPIIVTVIYILMAAVTIGAVPNAAELTLADVASGFMSPSLLTLFIVGGPIFAILTTTSPVIIGNVKVFAVCAEDGVFPKAMAKKNKYGVCYVSLILYVGLGILVAATGISISTVMSAFSVASLACGIIAFIPPMLVSKKYPHCAQHAVFKLSPALTSVLCILGIILSIYLSWGTLMTLPPLMWILMFSVVAICYIYLIGRYLYLKRQGIDLIRQMQTPYPLWEERERKFREQKES